ncbi:precorrin-6y C5,15-methyltransferase (decarboxylating) subunit CbiE [Hoyosella sp. YIM 151337]|uniref:precorrin-6y C5,15-methyltransferase (decarboxylating) subunit CbiE n=1 Tax=Hoyosella sp. YIM 151337 TaxID=2992742 RepID=UPI0022357C18|nr:precorrin-6y C5,15-methyltransferase (decarboxylating) subunit CbiE [Hoyosella sp. YIM 151337]MCW4353059.1 precorrin-6y C5,15-methyltransferase (decarboxylating) subunit CbiE [Hoyosella sp. YIM 151337]
MTNRISVVGLGADGWRGLTANARDHINAADVLMGSRRQLALIPTDRKVRVEWPSPLVPALPGLLAQHADSKVCVLASGDPMFHGIGVTLAGLAGAENLDVVPAASSASLACARLGWPLADIPVISLVSRNVAVILPELAPGRRLLILSRDGSTPAAVAARLTEWGFGASTVTVLEELGGPAERVCAGKAADWDVDCAALNVVAVAVAGGGTQRLTRMPGLPDDVYGANGQLTKQEMRALTLSALGPAPGELLWDVGAGSGSIAIEWMRTHISCRAVAFESRQDRIGRIIANAERLGVPDLHVTGAAPASFGGLADRFMLPDAVMVGGGVTQPALLEESWRHLRPGGRMVVNAVTAESEALLVRWFSHRGGSLRKMQFYRAAPLGDFTTWRPQLPGTQWIGTKQ